MERFSPTAASHAVPIEVLNVLGAFRDGIVLVGGWVPDLLYPNGGHMGSLDVDLAVSRRALGANAYQTILRRMIAAGYSHHPSPTRFSKQVAGVEEPVKVDLNHPYFLGWPVLVAGGFFPLSPGLGCCQ